MNIARDFDLNAISPSFIENPYPTRDMLRQESPVHENPDGSVYLTRYQDCLAVYRSRDMLSDKNEAFGEKFGQCPLLEHHTTSLIFNGVRSYQKEGAKHSKNWNPIITFSS